MFVDGSLPMLTLSGIIRFGSAFEIDLKNLHERLGIIVNRLRT
jgi:hypothetical protein